MHAAHRRSGGTLGRPSQRAALIGPTLGSITVPAAHHARSDPVALRMKGAETPARSGRQAAPTREPSTTSQGPLMPDGRSAERSTRYCNGSRCPFVRNDKCTVALRPPLNIAARIIEFNGFVYPRQFHVLFDSLFRVLFNFPSRYLFAIGLMVIFSLRRSLPPT